MGARAYEPAGGWVNPRTTMAESSAGTARRETLVGVCWLFSQRVRSTAALMIRLNDILEKVSAYHADADLDLIKKAYVFSAKVHQGQIRKSGEPYLVHPLEVAGLLADLKLDEASIVAGLLHDTIEDTLAKPEEIKELFGNEVLDLVEGVTKLGTFQSSQTTSVEEKQAENFRKMLVAMAKDIRVILVKLADRTHNMRTLEHMKPESQQRIAQETLDIYAPLANRLGIQWIKNELASVTQLHDIVAFRLILKTVPACYEALGLIHSLWKPVPGRFKDYIAIPKPNMYQSLHTTVIGPTGERIEIQMRTEEMHRIAEEGIAAHWAYKEGKSGGKDEQKFAWLRQLMEWQQDLKDPPRPGQDPQLHQEPAAGTQYRHRARPAGAGVQAVRPELRQDRQELGLPQGGERHGALARRRPGERGRLRQALAHQRPAEAVPPGQAQAHRAGQGRGERGAERADAALPALGPADPDQRRGADRRGGRRAGALREVLCPGAGRSDHRLHHPRARRHRPRAGLPQGDGDRSGAPGGRRLGRPRRVQAVGQSQGDERRPQGPARAHERDLRRGGRQHRAGERAHERRRRGEHVRGGDRRREAAQRRPARHRADPGRAFRGAGMKRGLVLLLLAAGCAHAIKDVSDCDRVAGEQRIECGACTAQNKAQGWLGEYENRPDNKDGERCVRGK